MGFLTDTAKKAGKRARKRAHVPEWMSLAPIAGGVAIGVILLAAFVLPGASQPTDDQGGNNPLPASTAPADGTPSDTEAPTTSAPGATVETDKVDGGKVRVPEAAYTTAQQAALATWNGVWDGVNVAGQTPVSDSVYPDAKILTLKVFSIDLTAISFIASVDIDGNGSEDTSMQVTVVRDSSGWAFGGG